jgi:hypothetical protein
MAPARTKDLKIPPTCNVAAHNEREHRATTSYFSNGTQLLAHGTDLEACAAIKKQSHLTAYSIADAIYHFAVYPRSTLPKKPQKTPKNRLSISDLAYKQKSLSTDFSCTCVLNGNFYSDFSCIRFSEKQPYLSHLQISVSHILQIQLARG